MKGVKYSVPSVPLPVAVDEAQVEADQGAIGLLADAAREDVEEDLLHEEDVLVGEVGDLAVGVGVDDVEELNIHVEDAVEESWAMSVTAGLALDVPMVPHDGPLPASRFLKKGTYFLVFVDGEWELAKYHEGLFGNTFRYHLVLSNEWKVGALEPQNHGKDLINISHKWVLLKRKL